MVFQQNHTEPLHGVPDSSHSIAERVADLVSRMTLEEKVSQMVYDAPAIERLGIPAYNWWNECLHGVGRAGLATVFPQAIGLAATWNARLVHRVATATSDEARAKHHEALRRGMRQIYSGLTFWSPNVNIVRDPRWGRAQETYGEDPYLTATMGLAFVRGLQGDDPRYLKLVATPKHFAVHSGPEMDRHHFDARSSERDLRDTYLPAFEACVREGRAASVMGAYNRVNGEPCCASATLLQEILRDEWGFDGYVVSDCGAIRDIYEHHRVVRTPEEAAALAVQRGCELNCGAVYPALVDAVEQGLICEEAIDRAVERLFTARFRLGMFDPPEQVPFASIPYERIDAPEHQALALEAARESIVLLKNDRDLLPLPRHLRAIAVAGPNADDLPALLGNYHGTPAAPVTPLAGIRSKVSPATTVYHAPGCAWVDGLVPLHPIPAACLRTPDLVELGLAGEYYQNPDFEGAPALSRVDRVIDLAWKDSSPLTGRWGDPFSVRWTGNLVPPEDGIYHLGVNGHSSYRLSLDGAWLVTSESIHHPILQSVEVALEGGRLYEIRLEHASRGLDPQVQLLWAPPAPDPIAHAVRLAEKADVVVAVLGLSPRLEGEEMAVAVDGFVGGDRSGIGLPAPQRRLLERLQALGKPLVLVLMNGSAVACDLDAAQAIVELWYPGQAGGQALADVLFGDYNPGGRLPVTFYHSAEDLPPFDNYAMAGRTYRYFEGEPLFPFGYGLSYTTFALDDLQVDARHLRAGEEVTVRVDVTNTGRLAGDEVVQLYVRRREATVPHPRLALKGFQRVHIQPGERTTVTFVLPACHLAYYDEQMRYALHPGVVEVLVGTSSDDLPLSASLEIRGP